MKTKIPVFKADAAAERFVDTADLSAYDLSGLTPTRFEFEKKPRPAQSPKPPAPALRARRSCRV
ncbi:MAG TPA: CopG family antitoxin [Stellaceae bacterium]|nr:CopG family antitoxin [Stellaceae bacterium]